MYINTYTHTHQKIHAHSDSPLCISSSHSRAVERVRKRMKQPLAEHTPGVHSRCRPCRPWSRRSTQCPTLTKKLRSNNTALALRGGDRVRAPNRSRPLPDGVLGYIGKHIDSLARDVIAFLDHSSSSSQEMVNSNRLSHQI
jgi:hypothetical protein